MLDSKRMLRIKMYVKYLLSKRRNTFDYLDNSKLKIVIALAADYGNLGDVAITHAQEHFIKEQLPSAEVVDFPISQTFTHMKSLKNVISDDDVITIVGGGNTGDLYDDIEYCRQFIIKQFPNNKIICFPQTIDFSETRRGRKALERAVNVYSKHTDLVISAREKKSYKAFKQYFMSNEIVFAPDIVLYLDLRQNTHPRKGITFVMRSDREKAIKEEVQAQFIEEVSKKYEISYRDTHIDKRNMAIKERKSELKKIWDHFKSSELIITDRLHGMIFSVITNTPCIAIDNTNKKISGVYNAWLKDYPNVKIVENFDKEILLNMVDQFLKQDTENDFMHFDSKHFSSLIEKIKVKVY